VCDVPCTTFIGIIWSLVSRTYSTDSTIFVLFDDVAEQVAQMKLVDLTSTLENVNIKTNLNLKYYYIACFDILNICFQQIW
jgi:predicted Zn-dependent protease